MTFEETIRHQNSLRKAKIDGFNAALSGEVPDLLEKARSGRYADNAINRRLKRVGQEYGSKKQEEDPKGREKKGEEDSKPKAKTEEETPDKKGGEKSKSGGPVGPHDIAHLSHMKDIVDSDPAKAYEIYQGLSEEAQAKVPQEVVNNMVKDHHSQDEGNEWSE